MNPPPERSALDQYIKRLGGRRVIQRVLICNNGIAAVKAIRSIRKWAYSEFSNENTITFVAMATPDDMAANAEYIRMADEYVEVPGGRNINNYANVDLIVDVALRKHVDGVWAGWGHASENPELPRKLVSRGIAFLGPMDGPMAALGDKISSTIVAQSANVPCVPWSGDAATSYDDACVKTVEAAVEQGRRIGFPLMIKASEGGGGKGIRKCLKEEDIPAAFRAVSAEVLGSPIFLMKMASAARHLEVQLLGDEYGQAISLRGRDCSVQRRHQKIIEEGPVVAAPPSMLEEMERAAIRLAKKVGYSSVGTVEYLFTGGEYFFLELNPRLQVEHPVTEWITGVNLPACQLHVACGVPLHRIPDIRRLYGEDPEGESPIDFDNRKQIPPRGHVIAVRITAENPEEGFQPSSGGISDVTFRNSTNVWGYFSVVSLGGVHQFADSQFGHIFSWGETRDVSRKSLVMALKELSIRGDIRTTVEYLIHLLEREDFVKNKIDTTWLDGLIQNKAVSQRPRTQLAVICAALHKAYGRWTHQQQRFMDAIRRGQVLNGEEGVEATFPVSLVYEGKSYCISAHFFGPQQVFLESNGSVTRTGVRALRDGSLLIQLADGRSHLSYAKQEKTGLLLTIDSLSCFFSDDTDPTKLRATMPGKIVRFLKPEGSHLEAKEAYAEIEVMKMYMQLRTPLAGVLSKVHVSEGTSIDVGELIGTLELDDPTQVPIVEPFTGGFDDAIMYRARARTGFAGLSEYRHRLSDLKRLVQGYPLPASVYLQTLEDSLSVFDDVENPAFCACELLELLSVLKLSLPKSAVDRLMELAESATFTHEKLTLLISALTLEFSGDAFVSQIAAFHAGWRDGPLTRKISLFSELISLYMSAERPFNFSPSRRREDVLLELREQYKDSLENVQEIAFSRASFVRRRRIMLVLFDKIEKSGLTVHLGVPLKECSLLTSKLNAEVCLTAKRLLMKLGLPSTAQQLAILRSKLEEVVNFDSRNAQEPHARDRGFLIRKICSNQLFTIESLLPFFDHADARVRSVAYEVYVRRLNQSFSISTLQCVGERSVCKWTFEEDRGARRHEGIIGAISMDNLQNLSGRSKMSLSPSRFTSRTASPNYSAGDSSGDDRVNDGSFGFGVLQICKDLSKISAVLLSMLDEGEQRTSSVVFFKVVFLMGSLSMVEKELLAYLTTAVLSVKDQLHLGNVRRVTFCCWKPGDSPRYFTFRQRFDYQEDPIYRHIEPTLAYTLELRSLNNFNINLVPTAEQVHHAVHVYYAESRPERTSVAVRSGSGVPVDKRFFVRTIISEADVFGAMAQATREFQFSEAERVFVECLNALEIAIGSHPCGDECFFNHVFMSWLPDVTVPVEDIFSMLLIIASRHAKRLLLLKVSAVEVVLTVIPSDASVSSSSCVELEDHSPLKVRLVASNPSMFAMQTEMYCEKDGKFEPLMGTRGRLAGCDVNTAYSVFSMVDQKRILAWKCETPYVYDYPAVIDSELQNMWSAIGRVPPELSGSKLLIAQELVLNPKTLCLVPTDRAPGENNCGMVVWKMSLATPECFAESRTGDKNVLMYRDIIVIANDITYQSGSFSIDEDSLFAAASRYAAENRLPRIYISANSGARIGLADEVKRLFRAAFTPTGAVDYLYLTAEDYADLKNSVRAELVSVDVGGSKEDRYRITDIIGRKDGLGVENLKGSGLIAGETSRAYTETFTLSIVTGRSVGIGAYVVRLGQRVIQVGQSPILLTGSAALNKVLGKQVYSSNVQIGGPQIMYHNGVSHVHVHDDVRAIKAMLQWLSFVVPRSLGHSLSAASSVPSSTYFVERALPFFHDTNPDRDVTFSPRKNVPYDPRCLLQGEKESGTLGMFDDGSFFETLSGWAGNVVTGRARLGGIPVGVVCVETRPVDVVIPADPADEASQEKRVRQAGQVWYPNSAFKTAQAIRDFDKGEHLPLFILANWRGFSGGMRDMFEEILKYGSYIVDALREYSQPIFIYLPPFAELRGGAWVVVDPSINSAQIEMFADPNARGGVLEPDGVVEIKFRDVDLKNTMNRLDVECSRLAVAGSSGDAVARAKLSERQQQLLPTYRRMAELFADLHDTPGRMLAKDTIHDIVPWSQSRRYFFGRLCRRLCENEIVGSCRSKSGFSDLSGTDLIAFWRKKVEEWMKADGVLVLDDRSIASWILKSRATVIERELKLRDLQSRLQEIGSIAESDYEALGHAFRVFVDSMPVEKREALLKVVSPSVQ
eukprot:ANDGO_03235.mRNA.1 Acetyl-CoA carboxylase